VFDVVRAEDARLSVLEPFVEDLVAADFVFPTLRLYALKILGLVDVNSLFLGIVNLLFYPVIPFSLKAADGFV